MKEFKQKPLKGLEDLSDKKFSIQQLNRVDNGNILPISNHASFASRQKGGITNKNNGHISQLGKKYGGKFFDKNGPSHEVKVLGAQVMAKKSSRVVLQYDLDGNFIKEWSSVQECNRNGYHASHISECCNGKKSQYKGFIWKFKG